MVGVESEVQRWDSLCLKSESKCQSVLESGTPSPGAEDSRSAIPHHWLKTLTSLWNGLNSLSQWIVCLSLLLQLLSKAVVSFPPRVVLHGHRGLVFRFYKAHWKLESPQPCSAPRSHLEVDTGQGTCHSLCACCSGCSAFSTKAKGSGNVGCIWRFISHNQSKAGVNNLNLITVLTAGRQLILLSLPFLGPSFQVSFLFFPPSRTNWKHAGGWKVTSVKLRTVSPKPLWWQRELTVGGGWSSAQEHLLLTQARRAECGAGPKAWLCLCHPPALWREQDTWSLRSCFHVWESRTPNFSVAQWYEAYNEGDCAQNNKTIASNTAINSVWTCRT